MTCFGNIYLLQQVLAFEGIRQHFRSSKLRATRLLSAVKLIIRVFYSAFNVRNNPVLKVVLRDDRAVTGQLLDPIRPAQPTGKAFTAIC